MADRLMSDAELRHRKKIQGHVSQATGALGLAALGGTLAASRGGRNTLRRIPQLKSKIKAPGPKDPDRDKIKSAVTPVLATSAGLGGLGSFNFASYTNAESRKRNMVKKNEPALEMGYYGEEGHPVKLPEIKVPIEKSWSPSASNFDSERSRGKRAKGYENTALVGAGAGGAATAHYGLKTAEAAKKVKPIHNAAQIRTAEETYQRGGKDVTRKVQRAGKKFTALDLDSLKAVKGHGGKALAGAAVTGGAIAAHGALKRKRQGSWSPYAKRDTTSAFGVDHNLDNPDPI